MKIIGFNFNKINAERLAPNTPDMSLKSGMDITDVREIKQDSVKLKQDIIGLNFDYSITYDPNIAKIELQGSILFAVDTEQYNNILKTWKEKKDLDEESKIPIFNIILKKASLKAIQLEEEMNLPFHIPLPSVQPKK